MSDPGAPPFLLGYGTNGFGDHPLPAALDVLDALGYDAVALTLGFPHLDPFSASADAEVAAAGDRLARMRGGSGAAVVVETGTRFLLDPWTKHRPTLVDAEAELRLRYLERAVDVAAALGATCVSFFSGILPAHDAPAEGWARLRDRLPRLLGHARDRGVRLSLEPEPGMLVETVADALRLHAQLGDPDGLGVTVDVGHCLVVEPDGVTGALEAAAPLLTNVQLDDMPRTHHEHRPFGEGDLDLRLTLATLADVGYTGVAAVELPRHSHDAPNLARASIDALRAAWADVVGSAVPQAEPEEVHP
ncbi:sugar phosphate isomerase/epimerase [Isoptericola variabilis]|uniref:Xylose isomerase domain-containing protein TIM barrel n=1 Tax=Isoptericola variabilis (strain 225) TaxID=743718 RepID=F6FQJ6_ISOV2|nr:sugar phosphate isomerase/epimerase family protein [Isoptericola variabilis]AEG44892.1 Xylose isomerase domain-containing protein TIM barrel [Isoptericola variabilis 225]